MDFIRSALPLDMNGGPRARRAATARLNSAAGEHDRALARMLGAAAAAGLAFWGAGAWALLQLL